MRVEKNQIIYKVAHRDKVLILLYDVYSRVYTDSKTNTYTRYSMMNIIFMKCFMKTLQQYFSLCYKHNMYSMEFLRSRIIMSKGHRNNADRPCR